MNEDERAEMAKGGVPYTPQQNDTADARKAQPKIVVPKVHNNGEKLFKKCPTCGNFMEVNGPMAPNLGQAGTPNLGYAQGQPQTINGRIVNQQILSMPPETQNPSLDRIVSPEETPDGTPLVDAHWGEDNQRIPQTPVR